MATLESLETAIKLYHESNEREFRRNQKEHEELKIELREKSKDIIDLKTFNIKLISSAVTIQTIIGIVVYFIK